MPFNVRGQGAPDKQREVLHIASTLGASLFFLQECNICSPLDVLNFRNRFSVEAFFSFTNAAARGVGVVFLNLGLRCGADCTFGLDGRTLAVDFHLNGRRVRALVVRGPPNHYDLSLFFHLTPLYWIISLLFLLAILIAPWIRCVMCAARGRDVPIPGCAHFGTSSSNFVCVMRGCKRTVRYMQLRGSRAGREAGSTPSISQMN